MPRISRLFYSGPTFDIPGTTAFTRHVPQENAPWSMPGVATGCGIARSGKPARTRGSLNLPQPPTFGDT